MELTSTKSADPLLPDDIAQFAPHVRWGTPVKVDPIAVDYWGVIDAQVPCLSPKP